MQTRKIVARVMDSCAASMHASRGRALGDATLAAVTGSGLTLSALALGLARATAMRHRVKCMDRLLGNRHLGAQRQEVYRALSRCWLADLPRLLIVVDWSPLTADQQWQLLRASVAVDGRSVTVYEEVHPRRRLGAYRVHERFVDRLAAVLPPSAQAPILVTDAGFRATWFGLLARRGWAWVGRVRNRDLVRTTDGPWLSAKRLYAKATVTARDLGPFVAVRSNPTDCRLVLVKQAPRGRRCRYPSGKVQRHSQARQIARAQREPWLLTCAPALNVLTAQAVVNLYRQRMRIEQAFRDTKNAALGAGLARSGSRGAERLQVLLLIGHLAQFVLRLIGEAAQAQQLHLQLMSTQRRTRAELSVLTVGRRVLQRPALRRALPNPWTCRHRLRQQARAACDPQATLR
jgi:hypothetical protein